MSVSKRHSASKSGKSQESVSSVGIGDGKSAKVSTHKSHSKSGKHVPQSHAPPHLYPEGAVSVAEPVFDCIVYLIYCGTHDKVAVNNVQKHHCTWLPFVVLPEGSTWQRASEEGVELLIGRNDAEMEADEAERIAPLFSLRFLHILRLELPSHKFVLRLSHFVHLEPTEGFQCCRDTDRVNWLSAKQVLTGQVTALWGPELIIFTKMLMCSQPHTITEFTMRNALYYMNHEGSWEQTALKAAKLTASLVSNIFADYLEHCYPSFYMCPESFDAYLVKYSVRPDPTQVDRLFQAYAWNRRSFLDFHEFLIGLVVTEPSCSNKLDARQHFIFRYYDLEHKGHLNEANVLALLKDANPNWSETAVTTELNRLLAYVPKPNNLTYKDFQKLFEGESTLHSLCRSPKSVLGQISPALVNRTKDRRKQFLATEGRVLKAKRFTRGTCWACRAQQYEYSNHVVTLDTAGRCVEPTIMTNESMTCVTPQVNSDHKQPLTRSRYSLEYVFTIGSVPNVFIDLIRDFYHRIDGHKQSGLTGLLTAPEDWPTFYKYTRILFNELLAMLASERKLVKLNSPALIIGDLRGNLHDLMQLQTHLFHSFPVIPESLVFLGNYSGVRGHSVECLIYLFSLKLCAPNKVFLLRGEHELTDKSGQVLKQEAVAKYGTSNGNIIYTLFEETFARLPVATLVDERILCTHSGFPSGGEGSLIHLSRLPKDLPHLERDSSLAFECVVRQPAEPSANSQQNSLNCGNLSIILPAVKSGDLKPKSNTQMHKKSSLDKIPGKAGKNGPIAHVAASGSSSTEVSRTKHCKTAKSNHKSLSSNKHIKPLVKSVKTLKSTKTLKITSKSPKIAVTKSSPVAVTKSSKSQRLLKSLKSNAKCVQHKSGMSSMRKDQSPTSKSQGLKSSAHKSIPKCKTILAVKSNKSILGGHKSMLSTKSLKQCTSEERFAASLAKGNIVSFGSKLKKSKKKTMFLNSVKSRHSRKSARSNRKSPSTNKPSTNKPQGHSLHSTPFDREELSGFLDANELDFLVRSHSVCPVDHGFRIGLHQRCLTVFSCSNHDARTDNLGAVALIDHSDSVVRFVRFNFSCSTGNASVHTPR